MTMSSEYQVKYSNKATKKVSGVLFVSDEYSDASGTHPCSAWTVFKTRESSLVVSKGISIGFQYFLNGEKCAVGPYSCEKDKVWRLSISGSDEVCLAPEPSITGLVQSECNILIKYSIPNSWEGIDGYMHLYKDDRLFLVKKATGEDLRIPECPTLYFGLTTHDINLGDIFTNRRLFLPLAKIDQSFYNTGLDIEVSDNPAGRPHVIVKKLS